LALRDEKASEYKIDSFLHALNHIRLPSDETAMDVDRFKYGLLATTRQMQQTQECLILQIMAYIFQSEPPDCGSKAELAKIFFASNEIFCRFFWNVVKKEFMSKYED
jgi:hypothetical protein